MAKKILIVDDSALVRKQLTDMIKELGYEIDTAKNGQEAVDKATATQYDVITMDINMPIMDGLEAVKQIMAKKPTAILMVSSLTTADASITMDALDLGAIDYISKPGTMNVGRSQNTESIIQKVKSLSRIPTRRLKVRKAAPKRKRKVVKSSSKYSENLSSIDIEKIILIGSSTGGPRLIDQICSSLPQNYKYPICIVQHMPEQFTSSFASRLNRNSVLDVHETSNNMEILPGNIYLARGGVHLRFNKKISGKIVVREEQDKGKSFFQPSVDDMMNSVLDVLKPSQVIGVLLTGIGDDGAIGMLNIKNAGGYTIGESEHSATIYGMPKVAFDNGGVSQQLDFKQILHKIITFK
ncbi:MAG: chemotaxis-specific protein-glutamate methyltransferase CheB [Sulfurimonas sp.]|nr:chemotaxis-specific protein-glutamate methyltransferase CheB [Sulfurimonas sp.]